MKKNNLFRLTLITTASILGLLIGLIACGNNENSNDDSFVKACSNSQPYEIWVGCAKTKIEPTTYTCLKDQYFKTTTRTGYRKSSSHFGGNTAQKMYTQYGRKLGNSTSFKKSETRWEWSYINIMAGTGCK